MRRRVLHAVVVTTVVATGLLGFGAAAQAGASRAGAARAAVPKPPEPTASSPGAEAFQPIIEAAVTDLAVRLGVPPLTKAPFLELLKKKSPGGGKYAQAWSYGDPADTCLIQVQPFGQHLDHTDTKFMLYHEVVHCYQGLATNDAAVTDWVQEGSGHVGGGRARARVADHDGTLGAVPARRRGRASSPGPTTPSGSSGTSPTSGSTSGRGSSP